MGKSKFGDRLNDSYNSRKSGGSREGALDFSKVGGEVKFYKLREGTNKVDIVPYVIKSKEHPLIKASKGKYKVGDMDYLLDIFVHKDVGPTQSTVICPKKNYGKPCPLCESSDEYWKAGKKDESTALRAKRRVFYNVVDAVNPKDGLQVLEQSHAYFEKELLEAAKDEADTSGGEMIDFIDPDDGMTIKFKGAKETFAGKDFIKPKNFSFVERESSVAKLVDKAISFDELMNPLMSYDEIMALMTGATEDDDEDEDDTPPPRGRHDDDEDDAPPKKSRRPKDDDDEDEEEAPPPKKSAKADKEDDGPTCPHGHRFGKDNDEFPECEDCKVWKDCARANR